MCKEFSMGYILNSSRVAVLAAALLGQGGAMSGATPPSSKLHAPPKAGERILGETATDIRGIDAKGTACGLGDYAGSVILLDISTAWCHWCREDAPAIQALSQSYPALKVLTVLSEDINGAGPCSQEDLQAWAGAFGLTFRVQSDGGGAATGVAERVYVSDPASQGFPTFVLIDRNFKVQYLRGGFDADALKAKIAELLAP
jgi:thiol-disulfide isomerase/thioredoxin